MKAFSPMRCALLLLSAVLPAGAAEHWIRVASAHFEMYTPNSEKEAVRALEKFEQVRYFFLRASSSATAPDDLVRVIAFSSEQQYKPYRLNGGNFAYYTQSHERDYIIMQDVEPQHSEAAVHEYTHLVIRHLKLNFPAWLDEGLAELYSSLEPKGQKAMIGRPLEGRIDSLLTRRWIDLNVLFGVDHDSPYDPKLTDMFYAQSWALAHMLDLDPGYRAAFARFMAKVSSGVSTANAFRVIYGKTVDDVNRDLLHYIHKSTVNAVVLDVTLSKSELDTQVSPVSDFEREVMLAELLSTKPTTAAEGRRRLLALEKQNPNSDELEEALGYLAWQQNNIPEARDHFGAAVKAGSTNIRMMLHYAEMLQGSADAMPQIAELVGRVLAKEPANIEARLVLASAAARARKYAIVLSTLTPVHNVEPENAYELFTLLAFAHANLKDYAGAKTLAEKATPYAKSVAERSQLEGIVRFVEMSENPRMTVERASDESHFFVQEAPPAPARDPSVLEARGVTKVFECERGSLRLHVNDNGHDRVFDFPVDPKDIVVKTSGGATSIELSCGVLKPQDVTVLYRKTDASQTEGTIMELILR